MFKKPAVFKKWYQSAFFIHKTGKYGYKILFFNKNDSSIVMCVFFLENLYKYHLVKHYDYLLVQYDFH